MFKEDLRDNEMFKIINEKLGQVKASFPQYFYSLDNINTFSDEETNYEEKKNLNFCKLFFSK